MIHFNKHSVENYGQLRGQLPDLANAPPFFAGRFLGQLGHAGNTARANLNAWLYNITIFLRIITTKEGIKKENQKILFKTRTMRTRGAISA